MVADTLLRAYPNAQRPTKVQNKMITALTYGYSVAARGLPGTGKSFAIAAWLLGLERAMREPPTRKGKLLPTTSALVLVPNVDLAIQYYYTIINMLSQSGSEAIRSSPDSFVQLLYRKTNEMELEQLVKLQRFPHPHIIIAPPTIVLDILADKDEAVRNLIDITSLKAIVLEEIDAAITKLQYFSKMKKKDKDKYARQWENKQVPLQILLDYIIKRRTSDAIRAGKEPEQPQLVFPTATLSTAQIKRFLFIWHREWLDAADMNADSPRRFNSNQPGEEWKRKARSNSLLAIEDPPLSHDKIVQFVPDNLHHYIVGYNIRTGVLRDAPIPEFRNTNREDLAAQINDFEAAYNNSLKNEGSLDTWREDEEPNKFAGYPDEVTLDVLEKLLEHDNYPRNVLAMVGSECNMSALREKAAARGIDIKPLLSKKWIDNQEKGTLPLGRTDMLLDPKIRKADETAKETGDKAKTTVWLSNFFFCRGLDLPGIRHLYILHRMDRAREYITYAGRVAKWPFATREDEIRDPRSFGKDRRGTGKIVSVILEEPVGKHFKQEKWERNMVGMENIVLKADGSEKEKHTWAMEGLRLAKIGCTLESYFPKDADKAEEAAARKAGKGKAVAAEKVAVGKGEEVEEVEKLKEMVERQDEAPAFLMEALGLLDETAKPTEGAEAGKPSEKEAKEESK